MSNKSISISSALPCLPFLLLAACSGGGDAGTPDVGDADTDTDTWPDLSGLDCAFTLSAGPFVIRSAPSGHVAFPDIARLPTGEILLVYREATTHNVDPVGRIVRQVGTADALEWSDPEVLHDTAGIDDRDPSVTVTADGEVLVNWFQYLYETTADGDLGVHQIFFGRSDDLGVSLGEASMVADGAMSYPGAYLGTDDLWLDAAGDPVVVTACSSPIREIGGSLFVQGYGGYAWNTANPAAPRSRVSLYASGDGGLTWAGLPIAEGQAEDTWLQEPSLLALTADRWIVQLRTAEGSSPGNAGDLWQTTSDDGGATWSAYEDLGFVGHAPYLSRLSNGVIVSAFRWLNASFSSTNVDFIYSMDEGATWSDLVPILDPQLVEVGYPSILELEGDKMLVVFYVGGTSIQGAIYDFELVDAG
jgi:sialidase-1